MHFGSPHSWDPQPFPHRDHLQHPHLPCSDCPTRAARTKQRTSHLTGRYMLADTPCEVQPGKLNNYRNGALSKWNQQFPKGPLVSGKECAGWSLQRSASPCCSTKHKRANYGFCRCLYLSGFLGLQSIFLPFRLILWFLFFLQKTSDSFKPRRAVVLVLQNPPLPTSSLSSILLYLIYCLLTDHMGNTLGKHASGFTFRINSFYDYSHDLQQ